MKQASKHHMDGLLVLLLFGIFAMCILSVLLAGARIYQGVVQRDDLSYDRRTVSQYLSTKLRQSGGGESVSLSVFGEGQALVLEEEIDGERYFTRLYCQGGYLRELFCAESDPLLPEDGEPILPLNTLSAVLEDGLLTLYLSPPEGDPITVYHALRGAEEVL